MEAFINKALGFIVLAAIVIGVGIWLTQGVNDAVTGATDHFENQITGAIGEVGIPLDQ